MGRLLLPLAIALLPLLPGTAAHAQEADDYAAMLEYLARTHIQDRAFTGASGAVAINMAAGDLNQQANLRSIAVGEVAAASVGAIQRSQASAATVPDHASAVVSGSAFQGASGLISINQASGAANAELNAVAVALAQRGIRETPDALLASTDFASAGLQAVSEPGAARTQTREVGVEGSALQGFEGVVQLNQAAGIGNAIENRLLISTQGTPPPGI